MNNIVVVCDVEHEITPGICAFCERDHLRERVAELTQFAVMVRDWYENAGNADPDRESPGSRELWGAARLLLSKSPK